MGKLAAEQAGMPESGPARPPAPTDPDHGYVRVVGDDAAPPAPPRPPSLRQRSRRARPAVPPTQALAPGPNTRILREDEPAADLTAPPEGLPPQLTIPPAVAAEAYQQDHVDSPVGGAAAVVVNGSTPHPDPAGPEMLHFDATCDFSESPAPRSWADVAPSPPDRAPGSRWVRSRPGRSRPDRSGPGRRSPVPGWVGLRRRSLVVGALALIVVAAVVGLALSRSPGTHRSPPAPTAHALPLPPATTAASAPTAPPTTAAPPATLPSAILVASSAGTSTYRVGPSATITLLANNGPCWVEIRQSGPYGPVTFMGDIMAGQSRNLVGPVWVRLGNPGAVTVDGTSISPPGMTAGQPYNLQFA